MKISISAIGRLRKSPEKELIDDYLSRFSKLAKPFGLSLNPIIEIEDKKGGGPKTEAQLLEKHFQKNSKIIALMKEVYLYHPKSSQTIFQTGSLMVLGIAI